MSVRRLAEDSVQPSDFAFNRSFAAQAKVWVKKYPKGREQSAVIPLLMLAQEQDGWVTKAAIEKVADMLDMPYIRALEVATFYTQFMLKPVGTRAHVQVCGTTPCMLRGSEDLMRVCKEKIGPNQLEPNADGTLSWEEVECQGACVNAPMVMIFKDSYEDLTPDRLAEIIDEFGAGRGERVQTGPQVDRIFSAAEGGQTTLLDNPIVKKVAGGKTKASSARGKKSPAATNAGRVNQRAAIANPAVKTPVSKSKAAAAAKVVAKPKTAAAKPKVVAKAKTTKPKGPERLKKPRGKADDLKLISGVGPKLEKTLNGLGFWHFKQIAKWKKADVAIVDNELTFKGRIERDDWIKQAKALAKGGRDEYVRVFGKEPR